jgi:hypothetical protein
MLSEKPILAIGNGESRKHLDLNSIDLPKIGCNAVHRDYDVDHLVCVDRRMVNECLDKKINTKTKIYTRTDWNYNFDSVHNLFPVPQLPYKAVTRADEPFHWGSGPYAVLLGALKNAEVILVGFDLYGCGQRVNNIYKGTHGYDPADKRAVDPRYWVHQIAKVFELSPSVQFTILNTKNWECPQSWFFSNVKVDSISNIMYYT